MRERAFFSLNGGNVGYNTVDNKEARPWIYY